MEATAKENNHEENILGYAPIGALLRKFSVPGIICMVVNALYNIVDQIFIGRGIGYLGNGATNVIMPLTVIVLAFSLMTGDGAAAYFSIKLGEKEPDKAAKGIANAEMILLFSGILITVLYEIFLEPLCRMMGATDDILPYALDYGRIITIGIPFSIFCAGLSGLVRADGSPGFSMAGLLAGSIINLIGDPLFIFVFKMGIKGAALATILGQCVNAVMVLIYLRKPKCVQLKKEHFKVDFRMIGRIWAMGISSFITQMSIVFVIAISNNLLVKYGEMSRFGGEIPMTTMGITMKVNQIVMSVIIGLSTGAQPIFGYNYGAKNFDRVKKTLFTTLTIAEIVLIAACALFQTFPMAIISIFGSESELYNEFAVMCLRRFLMLVCINGFQMVSGIFFQAIGKPVYSAALSLSRQVVFLIPAMFIMPMFLGVEGILWAGPIADGAAFLLSTALLFINVRKLGKEKEETTR